LRLFYWIIHIITGCPKEDLDWFKDKKATCIKSGRVFFNFMC